MERLILNSGRSGMQKRRRIQTLSLKTIKQLDEQRKKHLQKEGARLSGLRPGVRSGQGFWYIQLTIIRRTLRIRRWTQQSVNPSGRF
jgi:hypothetical protein